MTKRVLWLFWIFPFLHGALYAQWGPDVRLTNASGLSVLGGRGWRVATASNRNVHVVWEDDRHGLGEIYYKVRTDSGWSEDFRLTDNMYGSWFPCIAVDAEDNVHVAWVDERNVSNKIFYKCKTASDWSSDTALSPGGQPVIGAGPSGDIHLVWQDNRVGNTELYYKTKDDSGWSGDFRLTVADGFSVDPSMAIDRAGNVHVVWEDNRDMIPQFSEIYYKVKTDSGWSADTRLTVALERSQDPSVAVDSLGDVFVAWEDYRDGNYEIYYKEKTGPTWSSDVRVTSDTARSTSPSIATDLYGDVHVVWTDLKDGYRGIYYKTKTDSGWSADLPLVLDDSTSRGHASIAADLLANLHLIWHDARHGGGNWEIYYKEGARVGIEESSLERHPALMILYLGQNQPNPFHSMTHIPYGTGRFTRLRLAVYDVMGNLVKTLVNEAREPGLHTVHWDGRDEHGNLVSSGIYFCRLEGKTLRSTKKLVLLK